MKIEKWSSRDIVKNWLASRNFQSPISNPQFSISTLRSLDCGFVALVIFAEQLEHPGEADDLQQQCGEEHQTAERFIEHQLQVRAMHQH